MKISELLQRIDYTVLQGDLSEEITGICHDNRMLQKRRCCICISGARFDVHTMAGTGKAALLVENQFRLDADCKTAVVQVASTRDIVAARQHFMDTHLKRWFVSEYRIEGRITCTHMMADILRCSWLSYWNNRVPTVP